jgi:predicted nucleic acid-binding protein
MATYLLDTCVIIDALNNKRNRPGLLLDLLNAGHLLACCPINVTEVYTGLRPREEKAASEEKATEEFLASLQYYPISRTAARLAGLLKRDYARKGVTLNLGDVTIAAVALDNKLTLLTDNLEDFPVEGLLLFPLPKN